MGLVLGRTGRLEHFGIGAQASASSVRDTDVIPWEHVVRFEEDRIVVTDSAAEHVSKGEKQRPRN